MKLASPRSRDRHDVIELVRAGIDVEKVRHYLDRYAPQLRDGLEEAFRLLWQIRLEHQTQQVRGGIPPDDMVDPADLGPLARQGLKEAFRMIERSQHELAADLGLRTRR